MLFKYDLDICNIKSCSRKQEMDLLCKKHYADYIRDPKIAEQVSRMYRIASHKSTNKDKFKYYRNFLLHNTTGIHVPYIEHFPLETIFLYYESDFLKLSNGVSVVSPDQFLRNFDYENNVYIDRIKVRIDSSKFLEPFKKFSKSQIGTSKLIWPIVFIVFLSITFFLSKYLELEIPYSNLWKIAILTSICAITVLISGQNFTNKVKVLVGEAVKNRLLISPEENKDFLKRCHQLISYVSTMKENLFGMYGALMGILITLFVWGIRNIHSEQYYPFGLFFLFSILVFLFAISLLKIVWNNRYLIKISSRIPNGKYKFNLYAKNKTGGIDPVLNFLRALAVYNICVVISLVFGSFYLAKSGISISLMARITLAFFFAWNFASIFIIIFKFRKIKVNFNSEKQLELKRLLSLTSAASIVKYNFLEKLEIKFWTFRNVFSVSLQIFLYILPILSSYLITKYYIEIDMFFGRLFD